jgi:hypothetical protein
MKAFLARIRQRFLPFYGSQDERGIIERLQRQLDQWQLGWPPGHFYSPLPDIADIRLHEEAIFNNIPPSLPGIDLRCDEQLHLLKQLSEYYPSQPFQDEKQAHLRYYFNNPNFSYGEAIVLYCMIRWLQPKRIIEIGSGYSSGVILDTNERTFQNTVDCTFIEPYPDLLVSLLKPEDKARVRILAEKVQDVDKPCLPD